MTVLRSPIYSPLRSPIRSPLTRLKGGGVFDAGSAFFDQPALLADFVNDEFYWAGAAKTISDLTATANGYTLANMAWRGPTTTYVIDFLADEAASAETTLFGLDNGVTHRQEFTVQAGGSLNIPRMYYAPTPANYYVPSSGYAVPPTGWNRLCYVVPEGGVPIVGFNGNTINSAGSNTGAITPNRAAFFYNARFNVGKTTVTEMIVRAAPKGFTAAQIESLMAYGPKNGIHVLADSFDNSGYLSREIKLDMTDHYRMFSRDSAGGENMAQHEGRFTLTPRYWNSNLIIMDGGRSDSAAETISRVNNIVARLRSGRDWRYVQSGPARTSTPAELATWLADEATIAAALGSRYVETYNYMRANGTGSTVGPNGAEVWPLDSCISSTDFHPSVAQGYPLLAAAITADVIAAGW